MIIYSSPTCVKCKDLKEFCTQNNISFEEKDIKSDFKAKAKLISKGLMSLPVIEIDNELFNDELSILKNKIVGSQK